MNLKSILKMFGVNVRPEHIAAAEELIPRIPSIVSGAVSSINATMKNFDERLARMEAALERLEHGNGSDDFTRPAGVGATQRGIERGDNGNI
jgi:hypothetical protein